MKSSYLSLIIIFSIFFSSCSKDWLSERPDKSIVSPSSLLDLQALMDNSNTMNGTNGTGGRLPSIGETCSDNYAVADEVWSTMGIIPKNAYIWNPDIYSGTTGYDWNYPYVTVFYANLALEGVDKVKPIPTEQTAWDNIKGSALFYRAHSFFQLSQIYAKPYDASTVNTDPGIPLRLSSDFNEKTKRGTLKETYNQIIHDLTLAYDLLPVVPLYKTRPSKPAVSGLLARMYLTMHMYNEAFDEANKCLESYNKLLDYNMLNVDASLPFTRFNDEDIFDASLCFSDALDNHLVDINLYNSYAVNDLRKAAYFRTVSGNLKFKGSYIRSAYVLFAGIATDEMYLTRAECYARAGKTTEAMNDLNTLMIRRWKTNTFIPFSAGNSQDALALILRERRKELIFRGIRWMDLRRLNKEGAEITLNRVVQGTKYTLLPNSPLYTLPIPDDVIEATGIEQNER